MYNNIQWIYSLNSLNNPLPNEKHEYVMYQEVKQFDYAGGSQKISWHNQVHT